MTNVNVTMFCVNSPFAIWSGSSSAPKRLCLHSRNKPNPLGSKPGLKLLMPVTLPPKAADEAALKLDRSLKQ